MSPNLVLINTPNLNFCLSSSKTPIQQFKKDVSNMNVHNKSQLTHARINCALKDSNCDSPLSKMLKFTIPASTAIPESHTTLTLTKMNTCMTSPIGLPLFSNQHSFQLNQDQKGLFKACNGAECKGMGFNLFQDHVSKDKAQMGSRKVHTPYKVGHKKRPTGHILGVTTHNVQGKLITQGIGTNIK
ncbi:hypothetical protein H5410_002965 [Solanum commersonii]|uniref:Uncharacterized protein n=1 Tax=Solanum commersonii TaxID=4109 RepID=A0A9J6B3P3_SOLCO|nr:hypothetical protein H5410_002965 [Solanum commersonii]